MKVKEKTITEQFVDFVRSSKWRTPETVSVSDIHILFSVVQAAGFDPKLIALGKVQSSYVEQDDPNRTSKYYDINSLCPFKVVGQDDRDDRFATGWLDSLFRKVNYAADRINLVVRDVEQEIRRSTSFKPIQLTLEGDYLIERRNEPQQRFPHDDYLIDHICDDNGIFDHRKIHAHCGEELHIRKVTADHYAIICRTCCLRVLVPVGIKTFGELRDVMNLRHVPTTTRKRKSVS